MAGNDLLGPTYGAEQYDSQGNGDNANYWGGTMARRDDSGYTGGWHDGGYGIRSPNDPAAYRAAVRYTPSGRQQDVSRYRGIADAYGDTANSNYASAQNAMNDAYDDRSRGLSDRDAQLQAAQLQYGAATGAEPSRAELLGRNLLDQSAQTQLATASSAKGGPMGQASAMHTAQTNAAGFQQQGVNNLAALRADEMERARQAYGAQTNAIRQQDYGAAAQGGQLANTYAGWGQNRDQNRLGYEQLAWNTNKASLDAQAGKNALDQNSYQFGQQQNQADKDRTMQYVGAGLNAGSTFGAGMLDYAGKAQQQQNSGNTNPYSDMRTKVPAAIPAGRQPKAAAPSFLANYMDQQRQKDEQEQRQQEHEHRMGIAASLDDAPGGSYQNINRDNPYEGPTPGGIQREDPYGSGEFFFSDPAAKQAAFQAGVQQGAAAHDDYQRMSHSGRMYAGQVGDDQLSVTQREGVSPPVKDLQHERMSRGTRQYYQQQQDDEETAARQQSVDQKTQASSPGPQNYDVGAREVERGVPSKAAPPPPKPLSEKAAHPPLASLQQDANRRGAGFGYAYKPEFTPPEQKPGELNWGPSADEMEKNPLMATAVKRNPDNGLRQIDVTKLVKNNTAGIASLQDQIDELKGGQYG